jgi:hypothetical protein
MAKHIWNFSTVGGVKRVNLDTGADLLHLHELDQKLWTALSCPVKGLEIDPRTLELMDLDKDGQLRVPEVLAAIDWITSVIRNPDELLSQRETLPLTSINTDNAEGKKLHASAKIILRNLNKPDEETISIEDTADTQRIFAGTAYNGDGVISTLSTDNELIKLLITDIMQCIGEVDDRSGEKGINADILSAFITQCDTYLTWFAKAELQPEITLPFGVKTEEAYSVYLSIKPKVDDYFLRCRLASFDNTTSDILNTLTARIEALTVKDISSSIEEVASYPLSKIASGKPLNLVAGINPVWEQAVSHFKTLIIDVKFDSSTDLNEKDWRQIEQLFVPFIAWQAEKPDTKVEQLGYMRIKEMIAGNAKGQIDELIEKDLAVESESNSIILVDQLVRYYRDIYRLIKNFVTFYDFYAGGDPTFLAGKLYIDQRSCLLCIKVNDMAKHNSLASFSGMFLLYCECVSKTSGEKMLIVVGLTNGDVDNLYVGMNAIFYDKYGLDWDATVIKIIDNPISIRQAFWSPYRKVSRFIETQINKFAAEKDSKFEQEAQAKVGSLPAEADKLATTDTTPKAPSTASPTPFDIGKFVGIFAAISLALGAIGTAIASILTGFISLKWWQMPLAVAGIMLAISGPAMIMAYVKLRKRNLAPILNANGWAINARASVNIAFGNTLTQLATLPYGSKINLNDPFIKKKKPFWPYMIALLLLVAIVYYLLHKYGFMHLPTLIPQK